MKPTLLLTLMTTILFHLSIQAQNSYKIGKPTDIDIQNNRFFSLIKPPKDTITIEDSAYRIVHVLYNNELIVSYKLRPDTQLTESTIHDSVVFNKLKSTDSLFSSPNFKAELIISSDILARFPIESIYQSQLRPAIIDNVISVIDTVVKKDAIKITGSVTITGQYSDNKYLFQSVPQSFVRGHVNVNVDLFGLPFSSGYYYTTESNSGVNKINNFRLSFNHEQFYQNLKSKMAKKIELSKISEIKNVTNIDIHSLNSEFSKLQNELNAQDFQKQLRKNKIALDLGAKDTVFAKSYKYKKALTKQKEYQQKLDRLNELEKLKQEYLNYSKIAEFNSKIAEVNLNKPQDFRKAAKRFGFVKPGQSIFMSIKKMDIGTFDPEYTALVLSGVNLTGVNIELNPGNMYGAFTWGKAIANFDNPLNFSALAGGRNIISGRIGVGNKDKFLVALSILKGTDDPGNLVKDSSYDYYLPNYNYVIGIDAKYKIATNAEAGIEYAKSQNQQINIESPSSTEQLGKLVSIDQNKYSNAWNVYSNVSFNKNRSKVKVLGRVVDPFYYSFGTPYLRRDNVRIETKAEQIFWKRQLTATVTYRRDADNLYGFKQGTSITHSIILGAQLRIKKLPYLLLTYSPNYQSFYNAVANKQINSNVKFYNVIVGYTYQKQKTILSSTFSFTKQYNNSNQQEWQSFHVNQYALYENVNFRSINLALNGGINYTLPISNSDSGRVIGITVAGTKGLFKNKLDLTLGARYQKDEMIEERYIAEGGIRFNLGFGINCQVQMERHFITPYQYERKPEDMNLGRITLIKTF